MRSRHRGLGATLPLVVIKLVVALAYFAAVNPPARATGSTGAKALPRTEAPTHQRVPARALPRLALAGIDLAPAPSTAPGPFAFHTIKSTNGRVILRYYGRTTQDAQGLLQLALSDLETPVRQTLGFELLRPVRIYVYNSRADFLRGAPVTDPAETGALTDPATNSIYLEQSDVDESDIEDDLPHELTHAVFHQNEDIGHVEDQYFRFYPLWLDEGLATYDEPTWADWYYQSALSDAVSGNHLVNLFSAFTNSYPANVDTDNLCYAEAWSFTSYLADTYGLPALHRFLAGARDGDLSPDAEESFGADLRTLQSRWEVSLGLAPTVADQGYVPTIAPTIAFVPGQLPQTASVVRPAQLDVSGLDGLLDILLVSLPFGLISLLWAANGPGARQRPRVGWLALAALIPAALALMASLAGIALEPFHEWHTGYLAGAAVGVAAVVTVALLGHRAWRGTAPGKARGVLATYALVTVVIPVIASGYVAQSQADAADARGQYALALRLIADGEPGALASSDLALVHRDWANAAIAVRDYATATTQLRAAIAVDPADAPTYVVSLEAVTNSWGQDMTAAGQYAAAQRIYTAAMSAPGCVPACRAELDQGAAATGLAWANATLMSGDVAGAAQLLEQTIHGYPGTPAAAPASDALKEVQPLAALGDALALGAHGEYSAMNAHLRALARQAPGTLAAAEAPETPEPVWGTIVDANGASVAGDRVIFLAFATGARARAFNFDFNYDSSVFKVAATIHRGGAFATRLPVGYWYVATWDDPAWASAGYFNYPMAAGNDAFLVRSFTPADVGTVLGF